MLNEDFYQELLTYFQHLHPRHIDLSLYRIDHLLKKLGSPHHFLPPTIHVAGTNGKGSTISFLRSIYEAAGLKVHVYISPHLIRLNERIRLQGKLISDEALITYLREVQHLNAGAPLTLFEALTAAAFVAFKDTPADVLLLETGLGGRLDATNVISNPLACVFTPISIDHQEFLGETVGEIANEKAGIIKKNSPVFIGQQLGEVKSLLLKKADSLGVSVFMEEQDWQIQNIYSSPLISHPATRTGFQLTFKDQAYDLPLPALEGEHQVENAALAAVTVLGLQAHLNVPLSGLKRGIQTAEWQGRLQCLRQGVFYHPRREIWIDGAHNAQGFQALGYFIKQQQQVDLKPIIMGVAILKNRNPAMFFEAFTPLVDRFLLIEMPDKERFHLAQDLTCYSHKPADIIPLTGLNQFFRENKLFGCRIFITGSLYLVGNILAFNERCTIEGEEVNEK